MNKQAVLSDPTAVTELAALARRIPAHGGFRWAAEAAGAVHEIRNKFGEVMGAGPVKEEAINNARRALLGAMPVYYQTLDEFRSNSLVVPLNAPGMESQAAESVAALRKELTDLYFRNPEYHRQDVRPKQWVETGIKNMLSESVGGGMRTMAIPSGKYVIVASSSALSADVVRTVHSAEIEGAILGGKMVPAIVMEDYPDLLDVAIALARQEDLEAEQDIGEQNLDMESRLA